MKGILFICFLFANTIFVDAQDQRGIYKVTSVSDALTKIKGVQATPGLFFNSIQDIQFVNCQNAYILAEKTSINSSLVINSRCQSSKIVPYVAYEILSGLARAEVPVEYSPFQNPVEKNFAYIARNAEAPNNYLTARYSNPMTYSHSGNYFNSSNDLHNTIVGVIIIGSFQVKSNADIVFLRIQSEGHQPYSSPFGDYTRIGIWFQYNRLSELDEMINTIREKYNPDAYFIQMSKSDF